MNSPSFPTNSGELIQLGGKMEKGVATIGADIPILLVTAAQIQTDTEAFSQADSNFNAGRSAVKAAGETFKEALDPLYTWLLNVSTMLTTPFGTRYSNQWTQAGFINNTTAIPTTIAGRVSLALALVQFFTKNPSYEVPSLDLTAAHGKALRKALLDAQQAVTDVKMAQKDIGDAWTIAHDKLIRTMTELFGNLDVKINSDDTRWLAFGLPIPASITTPGQPVNLTADASPMGGILVNCDAVPNATRYRFRTMVVGVDTAYQLAASSLVPSATLTGVQPGQTVQIIVQAVSGSLQSVASDSIQFTVLLPLAKVREEKAAVTAEVLDLTPASNGNGHRGAHANGNAAHSRAA